MRTLSHFLLIIVFAYAMVTHEVASAQSNAPAPTATPAPTTVPDQVLLKGPELEAMLAPIALYPDSLLTQMLMASTYPLEIVQADRWTKQNKSLKGEALTAALEKQTWDASVKSLVNFPDVLAMMSEKLDLTVKIGDAFIAQQADVMNSIQVLRNKANATGNLKTNEQQKIIVEAAPPADTTIIVQQPPPAQIIKIEPAQPEVIYVPTYSPTVVYGGWAYPSYPPAPYYPPGYVASNVMSFGLGVACGAAWGYAWGNSNWGGNDVDIDVNRNTNINNNIDRSKYKNEMQNRQTNRQTGDRAGNRTGTGQRGQGSWSHNPQHRQGAPYRDQKTAQQFGNQNQRANQARNDYRGRTEAPGGTFGNNQGARNPSAQPRNNSGSFNQGQRGSGANNAGSANRPSSFEGVDRGGANAKAASQRGQNSRSGSASAGSRSGGSRSGSGASRSGGGGSRGGGGGGRGGGGGGGRGRSDVELKDNFVAVDPAVTLQRLMQLPVTTWNYKDDPETRHLGPMAQDFYRSFGIGSDDKTITFLDEGGVALSAIQGLNQRIDQRDAKVEALEKEVARLSALVEELTRKNGAAAAESSKP